MTDLHRTQPAFAIAAALMSINVAHSANSVEVDQILVTPGLAALGVRVVLTGDDDVDSVFSLEYRRAGDSQWKISAPPMRADPQTVVNGTVLNRNHWAASALFLEPSQPYELRLSLTDPDGGGGISLLDASTLDLPRRPAMLRFVVPGTGGGSGTSADPFRGAQTAADNAQPGDLFQFESGIYEPFTIRHSGTLEQPIGFVGPIQGEATIDGEGTSRGVITLEDVSHVQIEGLTVVDGDWGIDAQNSRDVSIRFNRIVDVDFGVINRRELGIERRQIVCDNHIVGRTPFPDVGVAPERGVDLRGEQNVVCFNSISSFGDCVSIQPVVIDANGNDVFGNDLEACEDDGIEIDFNTSNVRVWNNRMTRIRTGISVQPITGGPAYLFRNQILDATLQSFKFNNQPTGLVISHNTALRLGNGLSDANVPFHRTLSNNNLIGGSEYAFEFVTITEPGLRMFDFNGWHSGRDGTVADPRFKWRNIRYPSVADLPPGVEDNGFEFSYAQFVSAPTLDGTGSSVEWAALDLTPMAGGAMIDRGTELPNLNEPFVSDGLPDAGAVERGQPAATFGPRPTRDCAPVFDGCLISAGETVFADGFESLAKMARE